MEMERRALEAGNLDMEDELESFNIKENGLRRARSMPDVSAIQMTLPNKSNSGKQQQQQLPSMMATLKLKMNIMALKKKAQQRLQEKKKEDLDVHIPFPELSNSRSTWKTSPSARRNNKFF